MGLSRTVLGEDERLVGIDKGLVGRFFYKENA